MFRNPYKFLVSLHVCFYTLCLKNTLLEALFCCFLFQLYQLRFCLLVKDTGVYNFLSRRCSISKSPSLASFLSNLKNLTIWPFIFLVSAAWFLSSVNEDHPSGLIYLKNPLRNQSLLSFITFTATDSNLVCCFSWLHWWWERTTATMTSTSAGSTRIAFQML